MTIDEHELRRRHLWEGAAAVPFGAPSDMIALQNKAITAMGRREITEAVTQLAEEALKLRREVARLSGILNCLWCRSGECCGEVHPEEQGWL